MQTVLQIAGFGVLLFIFYQDLRYRGVSWYLFPLALMLILFSSPRSFNLKLLWNDWLLNLGFLFVQLLLLGVYFVYRKIPPGQLFKEYIGLGDILFFLLLALVLPFPVFPVFMVLSLVITLMIAVIVFRKSTVPLAGLQALFLVIFLLMEPYLNLHCYEFNLIH